MRIGVLSSGPVLLPALQALHSQRLLAGIGVPDQVPEANTGLAQAALQAGLPFVTLDAAGIGDQLGAWLEVSNPDVVCVMGFPYRIPAGLLARPRLGFFNLHPGALPRYRGPDPIFWQMRNREANGALTIHRMTAEFDAGAIAHAEAVPIGPEDTYGLHVQRLGAVLPRLMIEFVQRLAIEGEALPLAGQMEGEAQYWKAPTQADLSIDWEAPAGVVSALVRACNPRYGGALTALKGIPIRILEVSDGGAHDTSRAEPGQVIAASPQVGIQVACGGGETLCLDIVYAEDGFFSGRQLARLFGLAAGERLGAAVPFVTEAAG